MRADVSTLARSAGVSSCRRFHENVALARTLLFPVVGRICAVKRYAECW